MQCPAGAEPFRHDRDGTPLPLFVPAAILADMRKVWPHYWVEAVPGCAEQGKPVTAEQMRRG